MQKPRHPLPEVGAHKRNIPPNVVANFNKRSNTDKVKKIDDSDIMGKLEKILIIGLLIVIASCASVTETYIDHNPYRFRKRINLHKKQDAKRREMICNCSKNWTFNYLDSIIDVTVIQYYPAYRFDLVTRPALLIGSHNKDTVRILCNDYYGKIIKNQSIKIYPDSTVNIKNWMSMALVYRDLPLYLSNNKIEDKYYCDIKKTCFGRIKK